MKPRHFSLLVLFFLFVHHSKEKGLNSELSPILNGISSESNSSNSNSLSDTIKNTRKNILQSLEGPKDRVILFIKPAVKSDFSRNVTNILSTIWARVQESNSTIIRNPLIRNSVVIPINTTLTQLKKITAADDEKSELENLEVINLNIPEKEKQFKDYLQSSSDPEKAISNPPVILLVRDDNDDLVKALNENSEVTENLSTEKATESNDEINNQNSKESIDKKLKESIQEFLGNEADKFLNSAKSLNKRSANYIESHNVFTSNRVRNLFDNVQRNGMQQCLALALCESNCRPDLYRGSRHGIYRRLFERNDPTELDHPDYNYYLDARRFGLENEFGSGDCDLCKSRYYCPHNRNYLTDRIHKLDNFY